MRLPTVVRRWAYTGALLGAGVSIAANILHSYVPPTGMAVDWRPAPGAVFGAVFWPVALLVAVELFARWHPTARRFKALRWLGLVPVAVVAAVVSYRHMSGLLAFWHEDPVTVVIGPLAVDGIMVMAAGALIATSPGTHPAAGHRRRYDRSDGPGRRTAGVTGGDVVVDPVPVEPQVTADPDPSGDPLPDPPAEPVERPDERQPPRPPGRGGRQPVASADRIRVARVDTPHATQRDIARLAGVSLRTVNRYWRETAPSVNGARHDP